MTLESIRAEIQTVRSHLEPLQDRLHELEQMEIAMMSNLKVGDKIRWQAGSQTRTGVVTGIKRGFMEQPSWIVRCQRKDGTEGSEFEVYQWSKPEKI